MNKENIPKTLYSIIGSTIIIIIFFIGSAYGEKKGRNEALVSIAPEGININNTQLAPFWKVWGILSDKYVEATTTDTQKRIWGAIEGLASSQGDPYTVFFPPDESKMFKSDIEGNFDGVGMEIDMKDKVLIVVAPLKNSPAEKAGVKSGDRIVKIDGKSTSDLSVEQAVKLIRGVRGTSVRISFAREGFSDLLEKSIVRDIIEIPTLETEIKSNVFIIKLFSFTSKSPSLFRIAIREFLQSGKNKFIIDLRGNPGGYLDAAIDMASWFLPLGKVVVTEDFGGDQEDKVFRSKGYDVINKFFGKNYKIVILVDAGSASASEILAGALQEHGVAKLVGVKTFGKGSVQELIEVTPETSLKVTIARWLTPKGHNLSKDGLKPDFEVIRTTKDTEAKKDLQLDKAIEVLQK